MGGLSFAENWAMWPGASGLEEQEDDDGSGDVALAGWWGTPGRAAGPPQPPSPLRGQLAALSAPASRAGK